MTIELTGGELRDAGVEAALAADRAPHREHASTVQDVLDRMISSGRVFDADAVRRELPEAVRAVIPATVMPSVFRAAVARGEIRCVGFRVSDRPTRHAGVIRQWVGSDADLEAA